MIDDVDQRLIKWASTVLTDNSNEDASGGGAGDAADTPQVVLDPPGSRTATQGVSLYLLECSSDPPPRGPGRSPLQLRLRYLVTSWGEKQEDAHRLLGTLVFAAMSMDRSSMEIEMEVDLTPITPATWSALGTRPQPSFTLIVPLKQERAQPPVKYVRQQLVVQAAPLVTVSGTVVGPGDIPLVGARVELAGLNVYEYTDGKGHFNFRSAPGGPSPIKLNILAKGRRLEYVFSGQASDPVTIRFDSLDKEV